PMDSCRTQIDTMNRREALREWSVVEKHRNDRPIELPCECDLFVYGRRCGRMVAPEDKEFVGLFQSVTKLIAPRLAGRESIVPVHRVVFQSEYSIQELGEWTDEMLIGAAVTDDDAGH